MKDDGEEMKDDGLDVFRDIAHRTSTLEECISEIRKVKDVPLEVSVAFFNKYNIMGDISIEEAVELFRDEVLSKPINSDRQFLKELRDLYEEHRSDVTDIIDTYLCGSLVCGREQMEEMRESRFIEAEFEGWKADYDTLTTLMHFKMPNGNTWYPAKKHEYKEA